MLKAILAREEGAAMTAFMVVLWAFVGLTALGLTVMGIFLTHVRAMNAADAAAEAALVALKEPMVAAMSGRSAQNLARFWDRVNQEADDEWESDVDDEGNHLHTWSYYRRRIVRREQPDIADLLLSGQPLPLLVQLQHFLTADEVGCIAKGTGETQQARMVAWAGEYSVANHAEPPGNSGVIFTADSTVKVRVYTPYRVHFFVLDKYVDESHRYLVGEADHQLRAIAGFSVRVPAWCP